jgi:uridylate kinase
VTEKSPGKESIYKRIIYKISGEAFRNKGQTTSYSMFAVDRLAKEIKFIVEKLNIETGIVVGGGNIARGREIPSITEAKEVQAAAHEVGIVGTLCNAIYLQAYLEKLGLEVRMQTAIPLPFIPYPYQRQKSIGYLKKKRIVIFAAGTGSTYHTTDYAAAVRALEIQADAILKGTKEDGIYQKYPPDNNEKPIPDLTYKEALALESADIMDKKALQLLTESDAKINIHLFNHFENTSTGPENRNLFKTLVGKKIGTIIAPEKGKNI